MLRTLTIAFRRRHRDIPPGVTHVLTFSPSWLLRPQPADPATGLWELLTLGDFLTGGITGYTPAEFGPATMPEDALRRFAELESGRQVTMARFGFEIADGDRTETVPAYWLAPAGA